MPLAVFDIDGTLVAGPSTEKRFFIELLRRGRIGPRQLLGFLWFLLRYTPRFGRHVFKKNKAYLAWLCEDDIRELAAAWARSALEQSWFQPCIARLRRHQEAGDVVVLLSGTPQFVAEAIGAALGVPYAIGSHCISTRGRFRARVPLSHPFREEKKSILERLAAEHGATVAETIAYGDSIYDRALLEAAGTAVAVRPDEHLAALARVKGWEILGPIRRHPLAALLPSPGASQATARTRR